MFKKAIKVLGILMGIWFCYLAIIFPRPLFDAPLSTVAYDKAGNLLGAKTAKDGQWRFMEIDSIPDKFKQCIITYEDARFNYHPGFDPIALAGAVKDNLGGNRKRGGSTLTMQVMRLALKNRKRTILSKLEEISLAVYLEIKYSKENLLKIYATHAPFGGNVVGLEAACWRYYHKSPDLLSWAEASTLAVLPNAPSLIHPGRNRDDLKRKRDALLKKLYNKKVINLETYEVALIEEIPLKPKTLPQLAPHLVDHLYNENKNGGSYKTRIDGDVQNICNEIASYYTTLNRQNNINNIAIMVLRNETGEVISYIGNDYYGKHGKVDMIHAKRSSGSILKPLLFCTMLDESFMTSRSLVKDVPISINGYAPLNFDKNFRGAVYADEALQRSLNIPFVLLLKEYGIEKAVHKFRKLGLNSINKSGNHYGLTLILGGAEVSLWELCGVYASMARTLNNFIPNQSKYALNDFHGPTLISKKYEHKNLSFNPSHLSAGSIFETFDALKNLERPNEEGLWQEFNSARNIAWKTGTSFGHKDAWAIGVDANYTIGVWVGNADGTPRANLTGITMAAPVLFDVFNRLPDHRWFEIPYDDMKKVMICSESGFLAGEYCDVVKEKYCNVHASKCAPCIYHKRFNVSCDEQYQVFNECYDIDQITQKNYLELPADVLAYYKTHNPAYIDIPDFHPDCMEMAYQNKRFEFAIIYPSSFTKIMLPKDITGIEQSAVFQASHNDRSASLHWHIDDKYVGTTTEYHSIKITPHKGKHKLTLMDDFGNQQVKYYEVI